VLLHSLCHPLSDSTIKYIIIYFKKRERERREREKEKSKRWEERERVRKILYNRIII
jgi:hypothetical protein